MRVERPLYLNRLIDRMHNGMVKIITGIRRCGKSFLLFELFKDHLKSQGIDDSHIIRIPLDSEDFEELLDRKKLGAYVRECIADNLQYYLFIDEIQMVDGFEKVLNGFLKIGNLDIYVTGSNSKFLSTDILTEFRGRGDEVRVYPLSFSEFFSVFGGSPAEAWKEYSLYGGLPQILLQKRDEQKSTFLKNVFKKVYIDDIVNRNHLKGDEAIEALSNVIASAVGSLTSPSKLSKTFESKGLKGVTDKTVSAYIDFMEDSFLVSKAVRFDVKGRKYIGSPYKFYYCDAGLRNARLDFRQYEQTHLMENIIYNELLVRGYSVDVGVVQYTRKNDAGKVARVTTEVDFVANLGSKRYYIQSAFAIPDEEKMNQEQDSLLHIPDSFKKIIVTQNDAPVWRNDKGVLVMSIFDFLLRDDCLEL